MRGLNRGVAIGVIVLIAAAAWGSLGVVGFAAGHAPSRDLAKTSLLREQPLAHSASRASLAGGTSVRPQVNVASTETSTLELSSPNVQAYGDFGQAIAIHGATVVVGAPGETASSFNLAGHVYLFDGRTGAVAFTLTSPNPQFFGFFGASVAIGGSTVVVGAPYETVAGQTFAGHVYTFNAKTGALVSTLTSPNSQQGGYFGSSVAISGTTIVVAAWNETVSGQASAGHVYTFNSKTSALISTLTSPNAQVRGTFGASVAVSRSTIVVGATGEMASGDSGAGHAYTFNAKTGALKSELTSPNAQTRGYFGFAVAISGTTLVVSAFNETVSGLGGAGRAYTFSAKTGGLISSLVSSDAQTRGDFGVSVAIGGTTIVVGAWLENVSGQGAAGNAYTFSAKTGAPISSLSSPNAQPAGIFGYAVAIGGKTIVVAALGESSFGVGAGGHVYLL